MFLQQELVLSELYQYIHSDPVNMMQQVSRAHLNILNPVTYYILKPVTYYLREVLSHSKCVTSNVTSCNQLRKDMHILWNSMIVSIVRLFEKFNYCSFVIQVMAKQLMQDFKLAK